LIADAILTYRVRDDDGVSILYRFVELNHAKRSAAELARRIGRYARLYRRKAPAEDSSGGAVRVGEAVSGIPDLLA